MENRFSKLWGNRDWSWVETDIHCWKHMHGDGNGPNLIKDIANILPKQKHKLAIQAGGNCGMFPVEYDKYFNICFSFCGISSSYRRDRHGSVTTIFLINFMYIYNMSHN